MSLGSPVFSRSEKNRGGDRVRAVDGDARSDEGGHGDVDHRVVARVVVGSHEVVGAPDDRHEVFARCRFGFVGGVELLEGEVEAVDEGADVVEGVCRGGCA